jgi:hypothetical protein
MLRLMLTVEDDTGREVVNGIEGDHLRVPNTGDFFDIAHLTVDPQEVQQVIHQRPHIKEEYYVELCFMCTRELVDTLLASGEGWDKIGH